MGSLEHVRQLALQLIHLLVEVYKKVESGHDDMHLDSYETPAKQVTQSIEDEQVSHG